MGLAAEAVEAELCEAVELLAVELAEAEPDPDPLADPEPDAVWEFWLPVVSCVAGGSTVVRGPPPVMSPSYTPKSGPITASFGPTTTFVTTIGVVAS